MFAHAAAFGDVDGDGWADLVVGTFADRPVARYRVRGAEGPAPDRLLRGGPGGFTPDLAFPTVRGRTSAAAFADLDGDGDPDLVLSRNVKPGKPGAHRTDVYENRGGRFVPVPEPGIDPELGARSLGFLDLDGDGRLDLFVAVDRWRGGRSRFYRNLGGLRFRDETVAVGLPDHLAGLGVATSDVDGDGDVDLFVAGDDRLFLDAGDRFVEALPGRFAWEPYGNEDDPAGAAFGDVDGDGRPDLVIGQHFNSTVDFGVPAPVRLFLNRSDTSVAFVEATEAAGLVPLPTKAPHVEIVDLDNDGIPDILTSASAEGGTRPAVFRGLGVRDGIPRFAAPAGLGDAQYWVTAPAADVDHDGRLDVLLVEFFPQLPTRLLRNVGASGHWIEVGVDPRWGSGVGGRVLVFAAGGLGDPAALLGSADLTVSRGYSAGVLPIAHLGLGRTTRVDVEVRLPDGMTLQAEGLAADARYSLPDGCGR